MHHGNINILLYINLSCKTLRCIGLDKTSFIPDYIPYLVNLSSTCPVRPMISGADDLY